MTTFQKIDIAKSWLDRSGLKDTNQPLYQVIVALIDATRKLQSAVGIVESSGGSGGNGITALINDVVATGPGVASAVIQPNVVTYSKIQQVTGLRLVGNPDAGLANMVEIPVGDGLSFLDGELVVEVTPGVPGLLHRLLSTIHYDTIPATAEYGDLIRATEGPDFEGQYYYFTINPPIVEDFTGLRFGYTFGPPIAGNYFGYYPLAFDFIPFIPIETQLAVEYTDFFLLALLTEDFTGLRVGYVQVFPYVTGNNFAYYGSALSFIVPPSPANEDIPALWERMPIGAEDEVLTVVDGIPEWAPLPVPPTPIVYPIVHPWQTIPFDAGNFTAAGGVTPGWTVASGDVVRWEYQYFESEDNDENSVRIALYVRDTTVSGIAPTQLLVELPFNLLGAWGQIISLQENLVSVTDAFVAYGGAIPANFLSIQKIPFDGSGPPFDTTASGTFLSFEISARLQP